MSFDIGRGLQCKVPIDVLPSLGTWVFGIAKDSKVLTPLIDFKMSNNGGGRHVESIRKMQVQVPTTSLAVNTTTLHSSVGHLVLFFADY